MSPARSISAATPAPKSSANATDPSFNVPTEVVTNLSPKSLSGSMAIAGTRSTAWSSILTALATNVAATSAAAAAGRAPTWSGEWPRTSRGHPLDEPGAQGPPAQASSDDEIASSQPAGTARCGTPPGAAATTTRWRSWGCQWTRSTHRDHAYGRGVPGRHPWWVTGGPPAATSCWRARATGITGASGADPSMVVRASRTRKICSTLPPRRIGPPWY